MTDSPALLLEDVTLLRGEQVTLHVRFRGGTATTLTVPRPLTAWERRRTPPEVLTTIDGLLAEQTVPLAPTAESMAGGAV
jgi:hypothetical protein